MPWLAVAFDTPRQWAEPFGDLLTDLGATAVSESGVSEEVLEPSPGETPRWSTTSMVLRGRRTTMRSIWVAWWR